MPELKDPSEAILPTPLEAFKNLSPSQVDDIHNYAVQNEKRRTSDDQLWSRLFDVYNREVGLKANIGTYCKLGNSKGKKRDFWHTIWTRLCAELEGSDNSIRLIGWHLSRRGYHDDVMQFLKERTEYEHENRLIWTNTPENPKPPTLHLVRD